MLAHDGLDRIEACPGGRSGAKPGRLARKHRTINPGTRLDAIADGGKTLRGHIFLTTAGVRQLAHDWNLLDVRHSGIVRRNLATAEVRASAPSRRAHAAGYQGRANAPETPRPTTRRGKARLAGCQRLSHA